MHLDNGFSNPKSHLNRDCLNGILVDSVESSVEEGRGEGYGDFEWVLVIDITNQTYCWFGL